MARRIRASNQRLLPGTTELRAGEEIIRIKNNRIPHYRILAALETSADGPAGLAEVYRRRVLPVKTRTIQLVGRKSAPRIINTLLGYEVQAAYKRIHCPDMATARYLRLFTEIGCHNIRLPYDPTVTASILPEMERSIERLKTGVAALFPENIAVRGYVLQRLFGHIRRQIRAAQPPFPQLTIDDLT